MYYLQAKNIQVKLSGKLILDGIDFSIVKGQKIALVAKNGSGKTTFLNTLVGGIELLEGSIEWNKRIRTGFLSQTFEVDDSMMVWDALFSHDNDQGKLIKRYEQLLLSPDTDSEALEAIMREIEEKNAREYEVKVKTVISKLQLNALLEQRMGSVSGGESKRIALAKVLLDEPDFLILDEPTNHLDLDMIEWLENFLKKSQVTVLMVTHDRYFLERVCTDIVELERGKLHTYHGNYEDFLTKKAERQEHEQRTAHNMKQLFKKELAWIRKAPQGRGTKSVSREKKFYGIEDTYHTLKDTLHQESIGLDISIEQRRLGSKVIKIHNLQKSFGDKLIIKDFSHDFCQGERVGIIGKNGVGKTTFVHLLTGEELPDGGSIKQGETLVIGHYQQKHQNFDNDKRVLEVVKDVAEYITVGKGERLSASKLLERFLFTPAQQQHRVETLSGGEKRRLHLLLVLIKNPNFLILDEPTNDLDLMTLAVLEDFLLEYQGCLIVISHDRFFMDRVVSSIFMFEGKGIITTWDGSYSDYKMRHTLDTQHPTKNTKNKKPVEEPLKHLATNKKLSYHEQVEFAQLGKDIVNLEQRKEKINLMFQQEGLDPEKLRELGKELHTLIALLEIKETKWLALAERE